MSQSAVQPTAEASSVAPAEESRERRIELALVLFVIILPLIVSSAGGLVLGLKEPSSMRAANFRLGITTLEQIGGLALLWYVLRRSGRTFGSLGLKWSGQDALNGLLLAFLGLMASYTARYFLGVFYWFWMGEHYHRPDVTQFVFAGNPFMVLVMLAVVPLFEEIIVRGYLTSEFENMTGSIWLATFLSVFFQASYHLYQGWISAIALFCLFSVSGIYYARTRRLLPVIVAHGAVDYLAFLIYLRHVPR